MNWTELNWTELQQVDRVTRRVHWSCSSASKLDWRQRSYDVRCSVQVVFAVNTHTAIAIHVSSSVHVLRTVFKSWGCVHSCVHVAFDFLSDWNKKPARRRVTTDIARYIAAAFTPAAELVDRVVIDVPRRRLYIAFPLVATPSGRQRFIRRDRFGLSVWVCLKTIWRLRVNDLWWLFAVSVSK